MADSRIREIRSFSLFKVALGRDGSGGSRDGAAICDGRRLFFWAGRNQLRLKGTTMEINGNKLIKTSLS